MPASCLSAYCSLCAHLQHAYFATYLCYTASPFPLPAVFATFRAGCRCVAASLPGYFLPIPAVMDHCARCAVHRTAFAHFAPPLTAVPHALPTAYAPAAQHLITLRLPNLYLPRAFARTVPAAHLLLQPGAHTFTG